MTHEHIVVNTDPCFEIDVLTRKIKNKTPSKNVIMQFDHNSERFGFSMPRYIEGHDMSECDKVEVHFINEDLLKKEQIKDKYTISDLMVDPENDEKIIFTWLLSGNTSKLEGNLVFSIRFICFEKEDKETVDYSWGTAIYSAILVEKGMDNDEVIIAENPDVFERMKKELQDYVDDTIANGGDSSNGGNVRYYGDDNATPSDASLFEFSTDDETMTASVRLTEETLKSDTLYNIVVPYKYVDEVSQKEYIVTKVSDYATSSVSSSSYGPNVTVILPNTIQSIGDGAFKWSRIRTLVIPDSVTSIGMNTYIFPDIFDTITLKCAEGSFIDQYVNMLKKNESFRDIIIVREYTNEVTKGYVDDKFELLKMYGDYDVEPTNFDVALFSLGNKNTRASTAEFELNIDIDELDKRLENIVIPGKVLDVNSDQGGLYTITKIANFAFRPQYLSIIQSVVIPATITTIGEGAFAGCDVMDSIFIPDSVTSIEEGAFYGCSKTLIVKCAEGSYADEYAQANGMKVEYMGRATKGYVDNRIGDIEKALDNIITKYGLGGDAV